MAVALIIGIFVWLVVVPRQKTKILDVILPNATELELKRSAAANASQLHVISSQLPVELQITPVLMPGQVKPKSLTFSSADQVSALTLINFYHFDRSVD